MRLKISSMISAIPIKNLNFFASNYWAFFFKKAMYSKDFIRVSMFYESHIMKTTITSSKMFSISLFKRTCSSCSIMFYNMFSSCHDFQVFRSIIKFNMIFVMAYFIFKKFSCKFFFKYNSMFKNIMLNMFRINHSITRFINIPAFVIISLFHMFDYVVKDMSCQGEIYG